MRVPPITLYLLFTTMLLATFVWKASNRVQQPLILKKQSVTSIRDGTVCIIGASGYIGSTLFEHLSTHLISAVAIDKVASGSLVHRISAEELSTEVLHGFMAVIYLAGCTGRASCKRIGKEAAKRENVGDITRLARRMHASQKLLFASTSALAEGSGTTPASEDFDVDESILDEYSASMLQRERELRNLSQHEVGMPSMVGMRFGTVVGISHSGQRADLSIMAMVAAAHAAGGEISISNGGSSRSFLWMQDLVRAVHAILLAPPPKRFEVFNLASFHATLGAVANTVAMVTGARIIVSGETTSPGFTISTAKFADAFPTFSFQGTLLGAVEDVSLHAPRSLVPGGPHTLANIHMLEHVPEDESIACPVCKSRDSQQVLDLGSQPLANDFRRTAEESLHCPTFPLKLVRCRSCNHVHLSTVVNRQSLFSEYLYESGTSQTLKRHFEWLADKITRESTRTESILEIACNDGSQLDVFSKIGWNRTYCVDPAANIVKKAAAKGHLAVVGFWGSDNVSSRLPAKMDAIVAQNVLAHVPDPVAFLKACREKMAGHTRLYLQTSQCQMMYDGQFDTAYHEHISFFSAESFQRAAALSDLEVVEFETTPVHGISCLVTMMTRAATTSQSLSQRLSHENEEGLASDFFYNKFSGKAFFMQRWVSNHIRALQAANYTIGAYGAAAKGMVLLHFLASNDPQLLDAIDFVVDDAPLKQGRFCPGTRIPIKPTPHLAEIQGKLAVVVLAWNFWDEIRDNILKHVNPEQAVPVILPFPSARIVMLLQSREREVATLPYTLLPLLPTVKARRRVLLITHVYNEEMMLPFFIRHHAGMFDHAIIIDYNSTDASRNVIRRDAPETWRIVQATNPSEFGAEQLDQDVMKWEAQNPDDWKIALTVTEFLMAPPNFRLLLEEAGKHMHTIPGYDVSGRSDDDSMPPLSSEKQLATQRSMVCGQKGKQKRFIHVGYRQGEYAYVPGRHVMERATRVEDLPPGLQDLFYLKFRFSPWPEMLQRKLQIGPRVPEADRAREMGVQHYSATTAEAMQRARKLFIAENCPAVHDAREVDRPEFQAFQMTLNPSDPVYL